MRIGNGPEERLIAINPFGKIMTLPRLCFNSRLSGRSAFRLLGCRATREKWRQIRYRTTAVRASPRRPTQLTEFASSATARRKSTSAASRLSSQVLKPVLLIAETPR